MVKQEKITGTILKHWFINAYIDLEKNKELLGELAPTSLELKDINNVNYCMKNIVESLEDLPENDNDCVWILEIATEISKITANSKTSIELYHYLLLFLKEAKSYFTPVDLITLITNISKITEQEKANNNDNYIAEIFTTAKEQCQYLQSPLDIESICQCIITASQIVLSDNSQENKKINYRIAIFCIIFSALEYAWKEKEFTSNLTSNMIENLKETLKLEEYIQDEKYEFEITYSIETTLENIEKIKKNIQKIGARYVIAGESDPFGIGRWVVSCETSMPLSVLPIKTTFTRLNLRTTRPVKLDSYSNIRQESNVISIFEKMIPKEKSDTKIDIISSVQNLSFIEPIARTGVHVICKIDEIQLLQNIVESSESEYIIIMPSHKKEYLYVKAVKDNSDTKNKIILAETKNDLEVKYLCEQIALGKEILNKQNNAKQIKQYIDEILQKQRTVTVRSEYENIDEIINDFLDDNDTYISVLIDMKEAVFLQQRIEQIIYSKNPDIQLEIFFGDIEEIILLAR